MDIYDIERKLSDKADKHELYSLKSENQDLRNKIDSLEREIGQLKSVNHNRYEILTRLLNMLAEHPQFTDIQNEIYDLIRYL